MTSIPVNDYGIGVNGVAAVGRKEAAPGNFQDVWSRQSGKNAPPWQTDDLTNRGNVAKKDMKAGEEYRVRTKKREPIRNVEERAELSEEEAGEMSGCMAVTLEQLLQRVAEILQVTPEELRDVMAQMGVELHEIADGNVLGKMLLQLGGLTDATDLVTDENLYETYRELLNSAEAVLQENAEQNGLTEEDLRRLLQSEEIAGNPVDTADNFRKTDTEGVLIQIQDEGYQKNSDASGREETIQLSAESLSTDSEPQLSEKKTDAGSEDGAGRGRDSENREMNNLVLQTLKEGQYEPQIQDGGRVYSSWDANTRDVMNQIMEYMKVNLKPESSNVEMQLHPASLGTLHIQIASKGGVMTASFATQSEAVKTILENQMVQLSSRLEEQGIKVEAIEVMVQSHGFERNLEQGSHGRQYRQEPARKARVRRIDLNAVSDTEEATDEERLTRSMMEADGNTIDFTA